MHRLLSACGLHAGLVPLCMSQCLLLHAVECLSQVPEPRSLFAMLQVWDVCELNEQQLEANDGSPMRIDYHDCVLQVFFG